ncbi:MAG: response regulator [Ktedonobacterales bacterium]
MVARGDAVSGADQGDQRPILVVDDDAVILNAVEYILSDQGCAVVIANNGREALDRVHSAPPRLILLDMKMPVMDGWAFVAAYRDVPGPHAPIIRMTAAQDSRSRATEISAEGFIAKPFDLDDVLAIVQRHAPLS